MLKLKKLQILGFKSFCDRTDLRFQGEGIAAIVGPNGCGKSNISDAISWVLGEQSARLLRGVNMQDVIFVGTRERKPMGMAEVSLTLVDPEVYGDVAEPEVDVQDDMPDEWDESAVRAASAEDAERYAEEIRPGQTDEEERSTVSCQRPMRRDRPTDHDASAAPHVVLKIRRRKFKRTFKAGEIVVTRRLFRSGESEYLLNGKLCRLRDIQDIFMGTGLGPESYAIIEQGRIGQILSSKPTDRRAIIEEAAGITKFKTRKRLAEARLEDAKQNLARINDIFDEVTRQMNSLKRQASKAERYARLRDEMRAKLRVLLASKFAQLDAEASSLDQQLAEVSEELRARGEAVQQMEAEHGERTQRGYAIERESQENREKLNTLALEIDRAAERRRTNEERCAELDARSAGAQAEIGNTEEQFARLQQELETNRATLESANADVGRAQQELQQRQQEAAQRRPLLAGCRSASRNSGAMRFCRRSPRLPRCATASPRRKSGWPRSIAKRSALRDETLGCQSTARELWRTARSARTGVRIGVAARERAHARKSPRCARTSKRSAPPRPTASGIWIPCAPNTPARWARKARSKRSSPSMATLPSRCASCSPRAR